MTFTFHLYKVIRNYKFIITKLPQYEPAKYCTLPVPVAARSKGWVYGRSPADIVGSNPTGGMDVSPL